MSPFRTLLAAVFAAGTLAGAAAQTLTLDEAIQLALDHGPDNAVVGATLTAARAADAQNQARAGFSATTSLGYQAAKGVNDPVSNFKLGTTPARATSPASSSVADNLTPQQATGSLTIASPITSLAVTGSGTFQTDPDGKLLKTTSVGATLNQTILAGYFGGATQAAADKSALSYQSAVLTAGANRNKALLGVKSAYFTLLAAQDRVAVYTQTLGQRQDALKFVQAKAQSGTATVYDTKVAQAALRSAELDLAGGKNALATARIRLANLLGASSDAPLQAVATNLPAPAASVDEAVATGLKYRIEPQTTALSARSSAIDAAVAGGAIVPTVVLTGGVTYSKSDAATATVTTTPSSVVGVVGVRITPPTIDGGLAGAQVVQAQNQQAVFQTQLDQLRKSIPVDIQDAWATWQLNGQKLELAQTLVDNADVNRQIVKSQFDAGSKLVSDWLNAESAYSTAQLNVVNARLTWQQSAATLLNLMGL